MAIVAEGLMSDSEARTTRSVGGPDSLPWSSCLGSYPCPSLINRVQQEEELATEVRVPLVASWDQGLS